MAPAVWRRFISSKTPVCKGKKRSRLINADTAASVVARELFRREAAVTASLKHPNIVAIYARGETEEGHPWIAMEYVGKDAETELRHNNMRPQRAMHIIAEVARALDCAHSRNVVHQDIKPRNFLLADRGRQPERLVLRDFGSATRFRRSSTDNTTMASIAYAAPEVFLGEPVDARSDVYFRRLQPFPPAHWKVSLCFKC